MTAWLGKWRARRVDKALNYLSLAKKARLIELGEEPAEAATRANKARLVVVAEDAADHTWRRAKSFVAGTEQMCIRVPFTKDRMGAAAGRSALAMAAFTDAALALAFVKALQKPETYREALESLEKQSKAIQQRQKEARAAQRNKAMGKARFGKK